MEPVAREISKHRMFTLLLTGVEAMLLVALVEDPLRTFVNQSGGLLRDICSARTVMLWIATHLHLTAKMSWGSRRILKTVVLFHSFLSQMIFLHYFVAISKTIRPSSRSIAIISVDSYLIYNMVMSLSSALLRVYAGEMFWIESRYTLVRGLFNYMGRSIRAIAGDAFHLYLISSAMTMVVLGIYLLISKMMPFWILFVIPLEMTWETSRGISRDFFLSNASVVAYLFLMSTVDRLLVYNMSLMNLNLGEYWHVPDEDLDSSRFRFFQMSEQSMKYPQVLRRVAKSNRSTTSIGSYISCERAGIVWILEQMRREREILESRMWFTVPQVNLHSDKPKALVMQKRVQFVRRVRSYNFIEILMSRTVYFCKIRVLINKYKDARKSFLMIKSFMNFLDKHKSDYLLLEDLDAVFSTAMKSLYDEVSRAEKLIGKSLGSDLFCR